MMSSAPASETGSTAGHDNGVLDGGGTTTADSKVLGDLSVLEEQINLCAEMLAMHDKTRNVAGSSDEALLGVIGFLEACAPRMVELVEAAAQGALQEGTLIKCLEVNDRLTKTLGDCAHPGSTQSSTAQGNFSASAGPTATAAGTGTGTTSHDLDLDDLLLEDTGNNTKPAASSAFADSDPFSSSTNSSSMGQKPAAVEDPFFTIDDSMTTIGSTPANNNTQQKKDDAQDEFDAFFRDERTG
jgi:hypothetical protein